MNPPNKHRTFYVIAADMATYDGATLTINNHDVVLVSAERPEDALELSRSAIEDGYAPVAALDEEDLRKALSHLERIDVKPGEAVNLTKEA